MIINPLPANIKHLFNPEPLSVGSDRLTSQGGSFADILTESLSTVTKTDKIDKLSSLELLSGETDDLSGLLIDMQKAELSLQLALQIRNKIIDAYNEVMRMSV